MKISCSTCWPGWLGQLLLAASCLACNARPPDAAAKATNTSLAFATVPEYDKSTPKPAENPERAGEDWPEFLGPRGTGVSGETGLLKAWPAAGPPLVWKKKIGEGYAAPSVRGNRLVVFHRPQTPQGAPGPEEVVECFRADTGEAVWRFAYATDFTDPYGYNGGPRCTPLLTTDRCYTFGADGMLSCLDLDTGKKIWQRDTRAEFRAPPAFFGVGSTPILEGDRLIVMVGAHPDAGVVAFDASTGQTLWQSVGSKTFPAALTRIQRDRPPEKLASYATPLAATIDGKRHILCLMRPGLVSLDPENGSVNFSYWFRSSLHDSVNAARPLVIGDRIFLSAAYETGAALLEVRQGGGGVDVVWADVDAMQNHWTTSIHHEGYVYGFSGRNEPGSTFRCIELATGKLQWQTEDANAFDEPGPQAGLEKTRPTFYGRGSAILAEKKFIVLGERGTLALVELNPQKFHEISRARFEELGYPCWTAPVLSRQRLYISGAREIVQNGRRGHDYHLLCFDVAEQHAE